MKVTSDRVVALQYTLTDDHGEVLDSSSEDEPLYYLHGHNNIISGLEKALEGAETGFETQVVVPASEGYGEHDPKAVFEESHSKFPPGMKLEPGMTIQADGPQGPVTLTVVTITDKGVVLDGNHPLAGKTLHFDVEVVEVRKATEEELEHGHVHSGDHHHH